jgi:predicted unusual protein kinase regulating ubiquinone biosynthesis (AarF/ABC1/UbiB family)
METTLEQPITQATEPATVEAAKKQQAEFTRGQLGKARRAFMKAGQPEASEEVRKKWLAEMKEANVAVMEFSSSRLAKVIKGELAVSELRK